ncbi:peptidoglycan editing factor PgeF [Actinospica durhamensis]|uniref:Purine nucleoside phosphorylase n=1 Tax=Actinospica durhamensis TaxID=1508375 RepID=A0A941ESF2_9ACTN|nr:peptidoglycan editing factor PgeF [Actinospica durhamensis]MBR7835638.1 peptidoglycan editing factor PgeF [Actinospica durhamensis]
MEIYQHGRIRFAFSDRHGGVSAEPYGSLNLGDHVGEDPGVVGENRALAARALGLEPERVVYLTQVHGAEVVRAHGPWSGPRPEADASVTDVPGLALAVLVADCTPVLLADPEAGVVAVAHAGRPGMAAGVVSAVVSRMRDLGARPERIIAHTGPAVCGSCYEVPEAMRAQVAERVPESWAVTRQGTAAVDVPGGVWAQLRAAGVTEEHAHRSPVCAMESAEHYSYRREGVTGRFAGFAWIDAA